jgi:hypothetical protein
MTNSPDKLACIAKDPKPNHYSSRQKKKDLHVFQSDQCPAKDSIKHGRSILHPKAMTIKLRGCSQSETRKDRKKNLQNGNEI